jgi:hypothetical protein
MAIEDVRLISKRGTSPPTTVSLDVFSIAANLSFIDRRLKKAGYPELNRFFESDDGKWLRTTDVISAFESARAFCDNPASDDLLFVAVAEQLDPAIDVLRALHGLAELALEKNGKLLDKFDVAQGMPWDAALFEWLRRESPSPVYPELAKKSPLLDKWLNRFEIPDSWGKHNQ